MNDPKLLLAAELEGYPDILEMLEDNVIDSIVPGICVNSGCNYMHEVEPDQDQGICETCGTPTVKSILVIAEII